MSHSSLSQEELKYLDQTRQRLHQLTNNIASLKQDILQNHPLPEWHSLQASANILACNIQALTAHLCKHSELFSRMVVHPNTNFPGREQEGILGQILRKKLEPGVEKWVERGKEASMTVDITEEEEIKSWAAEWIAVRIAKYALEEAGDEYTVEEREKGIKNIRTGLRASKISDEDDE